MTHFDTLIQAVHTAIATQQYPTTPAGLYEPIAYVLALGGKRIRPVFLLLAYQAVSGRDDLAPMPAAIGLETYHNYTLLHDDLMDGAPVRRGQATVHRKWDANTAILSGDSMLVLAYQHLLACPGITHEALQRFTRTALEIGEGQQMDMNFEKRTDVAEAEYIEMIRLKTSVLVACATELGGMLGGASPETATALYRFGEEIGLAFQLQDDYLDCFGTAESFGKRIGGDILCNKKTFLAINAWQLATAEQRTTLEHWWNTNAPEQAEAKIAAVLDLYRHIGVDTLCQERINAYYTRAKAHLDTIALPAERKQGLWDFANSLLGRSV